ncbi:armadillo-type protein [Mycena latifolia]|nr:armadillo-type protein [Mycena latifolia]
MPPVARPRTPESIHSWWSDSNPAASPTISIHAAAKPLMRLMYHRDVVAFMKKIRGTPLSTESAQICASYLGFKYLLPSTKSTILWELCERAKGPDEAHTVVHSPILYLVDELLGLEDVEVRRSSCSMLGNLAQQECTAVLTVDPCPRLVSLLRSKEPKVIEAATHALYSITQSAPGAQSAVEATILDCVADLLQLPDAEIRRWTCGILGHLAFQRSTTRAVSDINSYRRLITLLRDDNGQVAESAGCALYWIIQFNGGVQAAVDANIAQSVEDLLTSPHAGVCKWACLMLPRLSYQFTRGSRWSVDHCAQLVSLLHDEHLAIAALESLCWTAKWPDTAQACVEAKLLDSTADLLESPDPQARKAMCQLLGELARHAKTAAAVLPATAGEHFLSVLRDNNLEVMQKAAEALHRIAQWSEGAEAVMRPKLLECLGEMLRSLEPNARRWSCRILGLLADYNSSVLDTLDKTHCPQLVSLLRDNDRDIAQTAVRTLQSITKSADGAQAAVEAKVLDFIPELLGSRNVRIRTWTCEILAHLAEHEPTAIAVIDSNPWRQLGSLLHDTNFTILECAAQALCYMVKSPSGAHAAAEANILPRVVELLESPNSLLRLRMSSILRQMARRVTVAPAVFGVYPCPRLVRLLRDTNTEIVENAAEVLYRISQLPGGVEAAIGANILGYLDHGLTSKSSAARGWAIRTLGVPELAALTTLNKTLWSSIIALLHDNDAEIVEIAIRVVCRFTELADGAKDALDAKLLDCLPELLKAQDDNIRHCACQMVDCTTRYITESGADATIDVNLCLQLVSALRGVSVAGLEQERNLDLFEKATIALCRITPSPDSPAWVNINMLDCVPELLRSSNKEVQRWACGLLANLAPRSSTKETVLNLKPCGTLVSLLRATDPTVSESAAKALKFIATSAQGAQAAVDAMVLERVSEVVELPNAKIRRSMFAIVQELARHKTVALSVLAAVKQWVVLDPSFSNEIVEIVQNTAQALYANEELTQETQYAVDAAVVACVGELLESPSTLVRQWTCWMLGSIARRQSPRVDHLSIRASMQLVSLLR